MGELSSFWPLLEIGCCEVVEGGGLLELWAGENSKTSSSMSREKLLVVSS